MWSSFLKNEVGWYLGFLCQAIAILKEHFVFSVGRPLCFCAHPFGPRIKLSSAAVDSQHQADPFVPAFEWNKRAWMQTKKEKCFHQMVRDLTDSFQSCMSIFASSGSSVSWQTAWNSWIGYFPKGTWSRHWSRVMPNMHAQGFYLGQSRRCDACSVPPKMMCQKEADSAGDSVTSSVRVCMGTDGSTAALTWAMNCCSDMLGGWLVPDSTYCVSGPTSYPPVSKSGSLAWILLPNLTTPHWLAGYERQDAAVAEWLVS